MKVFIAICIVAAAIVGAIAQRPHGPHGNRWEPIRIPEYSLHIDDVGIATNVSVTLSNSEVYGLSKARVSNFTKDAAGQHDGFTATVRKVYIQGRHVTSGETSLASSGVFSASGFYAIRVNNVRFEQAVGTGEKSISVESVNTWFDGYPNKQIAKTVNDYLSAQAPVAIEDNQAFVIAELEKVFESLKN